MIDREIWGKIIKDHLQKDVRLVERNIENYVSVPGRALAIVGPRRAGKTYSMFQIIGDLAKSMEKNRTVYINFEDFRLENLELKDMETLLDVYYTLFPENSESTCFFFLDEVQALEKWEKFVRHLLDKNQKVFVTGSSSKLLSKEIATQLRGRSIKATALPLSFEEILKFNRIKTQKFYSTKETAEIKKLLNEYLCWGSYPEVALNKELRKEILDEILNLTIFKDIVERWGVSNTKALKLLFSMAAKSTHLSISKAYRNLKGIGITVGKGTVANYLEYMHDSLVFYPLKAFEKSYKKQEMLGFKPYLVDNGLLTVLGTEDKGRLFENLVFTELLKKGFEANRDLFYYAGKWEVDFLLKKGGKVNKLIQVSYSLEGEKTKNREMRAIIKASKKLGCNDLTIISWSEEETIEEQGKKVKIVPFNKWLLECSASKPRRLHSKKTCFENLARLRKKQ